MAVRLDLLQDLVDLAFEIEAVAILEQNLFSEGFLKRGDIADVSHAATTPVLLRADNHNFAVIKMPLVLERVNAREFLARQVLEEPPLRHSPMLLHNEKESPRRHYAHIVVQDGGFALDLPVEQKPDMMVIHHRPVDEEIDFFTAHRLEGVADLRGLLRIVMMRGKMNQFSSSSTAVSSQWSFFGHFEQSLQIFCGNSSFSTVLNPSR